ncbi:ELM1/GtrOC1 family putative glycosyltransferase [Oceanibacterium hippocampi]|uniref:Mitochondrial fission ELM1 n=1 Tax=Oceanibacterium hippocampi TaxID=745714 RepID=A0A1Y5U0U7_9PROT|nr:ELM1/GtrOC1 family putative glycosyltransferase [Oceanibacterium hippocampi]SLN76240.1 hypothetical protein OCH7691_04074 [Oceanibacterium hippocampi]
MSEFPSGRPEATPGTWLLLGDKLGDNAQVSVIADALGWPCERKDLVFKPEYQLGKPAFEASLYHIDPERSAPLEPPWPELILTVGRRPSMAALWVRRQSGNRTKIVMLGRPKKYMSDIALVIATPQYRLPSADNVVHLELPLMRVDEAAIAAAAAEWAERFAALPRPITAVLVGGATKPFRFDEAAANDLLDAAFAAHGEGGTLYLTTSRRTRPEAVDALRRLLPANARLFSWGAGAAENPYRALLALADRFIVTGDSVSMMVEVVRLGRPLAIYPLPIAGGIATRARLAFGRLLHPAPDAGALGRLVAPLGQALYRIGLVGFSRDFDRFHRKLAESGVATILPAPFAVPSDRFPDEAAMVAERIRGLFHEP